MFKRVGAESIITSDIDDIKKASKIILPGVGSFDHGIKSLKKSLFFETLENEVLEKQKPILGICLGMQLLTNGSEEGNEKGLGWINANTIKFNLDNKNLSIPHMGWNKITPVQKNILYNELNENKFYFVHSYHVVCNNEQNILATTEYSQKIVCSIIKKNIYGVQFHPEKSHKYGMKLLKNFSEIK
jgi:glutamine amidotransferase